MSEEMARRTREGMRKFFARPPAEVFEDIVRERLKGIDNVIDAWHAGEDSQWSSLHEALGMTEAEYEVFCNNPRLFVIENYLTGEADKVPDQSPMTDLSPVVADLLRRVEALESRTAAPAKDWRLDPMGAMPPPAMPPAEQAKIRCIVIAEGDYEQSHEFSTRAEYDAFSRGVDAGAGLYGGDSYYVVTIEDLGKYGKRIERLIREHLGGASE